MSRPPRPPSRWTSPPIHASSFPSLQAGEYVEASKAAVKVEGHNKVVTTLLVANSYEQDDLVGEGGSEGKGGIR